jgi:preprotein translocase subunit Sss1
MSISKIAKVFGIIFVLVGVLGFVPGITNDGHLLGVFEVNTLHNIIHLLTGIFALVLAKNSAKMFFKVFGVVYLIVTIVGFVQGGTVLGLFGVNMADNVLHLVIAAFALWLGFMKKESMSPMM